jgi:hypothetical protein
MTTVTPIRDPAVRGPIETPLGAQIVLLLSEVPRPEASPCHRERCLDVGEQLVSNQQGTAAIIARMPSGPSSSVAAWAGVNFPEEV